MAPLACPSCGAALPFSTSFAVFAVCAYCGAAVVRRDRDVESIGVVADLPEEVSPWQLGASIEVDHRRYTLVGRVRMAWADGVWTEWFATGANDAAAWLAEAQGTLAVSVPCPADQAEGLDPAVPPALNQAVRIRGIDYRVADLKEARCIGVEGELPFPAPVGRTSTGADMLSRDGGFAGAEYGPEGMRLFVGRYATLAELQPRGLRVLEGWPAPAFA